MKTIFPLTCVTFLSLATLGVAQSTDAVIARNDNRAIVKKSIVNKPEERRSENLRQSTSTSFILPFARTGSTSKTFLPDNKVGPNGEDIMMERSSLYYINSKGKKVGVKKSQLKHKPKHS